MDRMLRTLIALGAALVMAGPAAAATSRIPDRVMLQPPDLGGAVIGPVEPGLTHSLLPQPCPGHPVRRPVATRSLAADYAPRARIYENVARYDRDDARTYLNELKAQLVRCDAGGDGTGYHRVAEGWLGPDSVLFVGQYDEGNRWVAYAAAATGTYVVVIMVADPVAGAGDLTVANGIAASALARLR
jgi:hypothetical protein